MRLKGGGFLGRLRTMMMVMYRKNPFHIFTLQPGGDFVNGGNVVPALKALPTGNRTQRPVPCGLLNGQCKIAGDCSGFF